MPTKAELAARLRALQEERDTFAAWLAVYALAMASCARTLRRAQELEEGEEPPLTGLDQAERYDTAIEEVFDLVRRLPGAVPASLAAGLLEGAILVLGGFGEVPRVFTLYRGVRGRFEVLSTLDSPRKVNALLSREGYRCVAPIRVAGPQGLYLREEGQQ